ncbi:unnamed protein product [Calypogeia fissa]
MEACGLSPWQPPADMERRRLADLERFKRKNPSYVVLTSEAQELEWNWNRNSGGEKPKSVGEQSPRRSPKPSNNENRWSLETTLELLDEVKAFVRSKKLPTIGSSKETWRLIASKLSNPCGLQLDKLARSCQVKFENIRRYLREGKLKRFGVEAEVKDSMADYDEIRAQFAGRKRYLSYGPCTPETLKEILEVSIDSEEDTLSRTVQSTMIVGFAKLDWTMGNPALTHR